MVSSNVVFALFAIIAIASALPIEGVPDVGAPDVGGIIGGGNPTEGLGGIIQTLMELLKELQGKLPVPGIPGLPTIPVEVPTVTLPTLPVTAPSIPTV